MDEKKLQAFIQWLPTKFEEFQNKTPDEIAQSLNDLYNKGEEGKTTLQNMWQTFEQEANTQTGMFKAGGKLDQLVQKYAKGGKSTKKCSCGCELIMKKAKGGVIEECACGCKMQSKQMGGPINFQTPSVTQTNKTFNLVTKNSPIGLNKKTPMFSMTAPLNQNWGNWKSWVPSKNTSLLANKGFGSRLGSILNKIK